jgi:hypothetical protein
MSGGGSSAYVNVRNTVTGAGQSGLNVVTLGGYNKATGRGSSYFKDVLNASTGGAIEGIQQYQPEAPTPEGAPTMEDIAAREPDKERRRRQRMAALMAQGRQGTILTGPGGATTPNNSIGGGGKQMVGA